MRLYFRLFCAYRFVLSLLHTMNKFACHCSHLYSSLQWQDPMWRRGKLIWLVDNDQKWTVILLYIKTTVPPKCIYWYTFWQNIFKREVLLKTSNDFLNKSSKYSIIFTIYLYVIQSFTISNGGRHMTFQDNCLICLFLLMCIYCCYCCLE